jgi:hypothetical protein
MFAVEKASTRSRHPGTRRASADANHCVKRRWVARVARLAGVCRRTTEHLASLSAYRESGSTPVPFRWLLSAGVGPSNRHRNPLTGRRRSGTHDILTMAPAFTTWEDKFRRLLLRLVISK